MGLTGWSRGTEDIDCIVAEHPERDLGQGHRCSRPHPSGTRQCFTRPHVHSGVSEESTSSIPQSQSAVLQAPYLSSASDFRGGRLQIRPSCQGRKGPPSLPISRAAIERYGDRCDLGGLPRLWRLGRL